MSRFIVPAALLFGMLVGPVASSSAADPAPAGKIRPVKALLIVGGCCHDYDFQKRIIADGIAARAHVDFTVVHDGGSATDVKIKLYEDPKWADQFDVIIHDECFANVKEQEWMDRVLAPHKAGKPAVLLHCAMHCYRSGTDEWFKFCGIHSTGHGPQQPIDVSIVDRDHPTMKSSEDWTTINEELYNNVKLFDTAHPLQRGKQSYKTKEGEQKDAEYVVTWTNTYGDNKTKVFATTLGHNSYTCADPRYLDMVTRGLLWACGCDTPMHYKKDFDAKSHKFEWQDKLQPPQNKGPQPTKAPGKGKEGDKPKAAASSIPPTPGKENLSFHRPGKASSHQGGNDAANAFDGDTNTRWCASGGGVGEWLKVDLGTPQELSGCRIVWEFGNRDYRYRVEGSDDGEQWRTLVDQTAGSSADKMHLHQLTGAKARHVRLHVTGLQPGSWASVYEFDLFGTKDAAPGSAAQAAATDPRAALLKTVKVPEGFQATIFAAPPEIGYPTCLCAAPDGTLYVGVDENGSLDRAANRGRIVRVRDTDDDGQADEFLQFTKLDSPRGVVWDDGRLYVLHPPTLSVHYDDDLDGDADRSEVLVEGIGFDLNFRGADHTTNGIRLGIDGFLYVAVGDYGFLKAKGRDGRELQLHGGGIVRVRTDGTGLEIVSRGQRNIYDVAIDPFMNLFTRDNTNDGGGWNVRISHVVPGGNYGYPRLFTNFPDEIIPAMSDVGGGSPCGALYLDEPQAFPAPYGQGLYTVEWGRNQIVRQPLTPDGATFKVQEEPLFHLPRPTDMDVDARGNLYISSWKDGGFTYSGPGVGFIACVQASHNSNPGTVPKFRDLTLTQLVEQIGGPSATHRQAAQRELLRRSDADSALPALSKLAHSDAEIASRAAAIFTMAQLTHREAPHYLEELRQGDTHASALLGLADCRATTRDRLAGYVCVGAAVQDPRVRLVAAHVGGRLDDYDVKSALVELACDADRTVSHVAVNSLIELKACDHCIFGLSGPIRVNGPARTPEQFAAICRALQGMHDPRVIDQLLPRKQSIHESPVLVPKRPEAEQKAILSALCRLAKREDNWDGKWWGTRPDTTGPYYYPVDWSETPRIVAALESERTRANEELRLWLTIEALRNRVTLSGAAADIVRQAERDPAFRPSAIRILGQLPELDAVADRFLFASAQDAKLPADQRAAAYTMLAKRAEKTDAYPATLAAFAAIGIGEAPEPLRNVRSEFFKSASGGKQFKVLTEAAAGEDAAVRRLALNMLLNVTLDEKTKQDRRDAANRTIEGAWKSSAATVDLLNAIAAADADGLADRVQALRKSDDAAVKAAAEFAAKELRLDERAKNAKTIVQFSFDEVQAKLSDAKGDLKRGTKLFVKQGCVNCHAVSASEPPKGPFLGGIAARYKRHELIESVLKPSHKIAQGFETQYFVTDDGLMVEGFVVRESGDEVELRNANGVASIVKKKSVEERGRRELSVMPTGLADRLTLDDLAGLLAYLESLPGK